MSPQLIVSRNACLCLEKNNNIAITLCLTIAPNLHSQSDRGKFVDASLFGRAWSPQWKNCKLSNISHTWYVPAVVTKYVYPYPNPSEFPAHTFWKETIFLPRPRNVQAFPHKFPLGGMSAAIIVPTYLLPTKRYSYWDEEIPQKKVLKRGKNISKVHKTEDGETRDVG